jgi:pyruvate,water dikinase
VATPLGWSIWSDIGDRMCRDLSYAIGVFDGDERRQPPPGPDRIITPFYGRVTMRMEWLAVVGDRVPGTTGAQAIAGMLGEAPDAMRFSPTRRRYPVVAWRLPHAAITATRQVRRLAPEFHTWWRRETQALPAADLGTATATFVAATERFSTAMTAHGIALFAAITPLINTLTSVVERAGVGDVGVLSGTGGAEMAMIEDIWRASRGQRTLDEVIAEHGFHGPLEGEISSLVWREQPKPLVKMIEHYASRDEDASPVAREARARARLPEMQRQVLAALPAYQRPAVRALMTLAARTIPLRGVGKASFLQALDVARAAARRIGEHQAAAGLLNDPADVFYLTVPELSGPWSADARQLVTKRRARRDEYLAVTLPSWWRGCPTPEPRAQPDNTRSDDDDQTLTVSGIGASSGTVEGVVRIVTDPNFDNIEPDEILVAPTTDPSWASIMFVAAALVVDIGSTLSHAAVVARELGLPCVVNTGSGTTTLRTGDRVRVDGTAGTVELLGRPSVRPHLDRRPPIGG